MFYSITFISQLMLLVTLPIKILHTKHTISLQIV